MRVATNQFYRTNIINMQNSASNINKLQQQISSGIKTNLIKDDINIGNKILTIQNKQQQITNYNINIEHSIKNLNLADITLKQINDLIQTVRNLTLGLGNGDIIKEDCANVASQIKDITAQIINLANTQDEFGNYIFSGTTNNKPYIKDNNDNYIYSGNNLNNKIKISDNLYITNQENAFNIFEQVSCIQNLNKLQTEILNGNKDYALNDGLNNIDASLVNLTDIRANIGVKLNTLNNNLANNTDYNIYLNETLNKLQSTDILQAVSDLELNKTILEATQLSFIKISNISLINKISI